VNAAELLHALAAGDEAARESAAAALAEQADPTHADPALADALAAASRADASERVRGYAALGLAALRDARAPDALVATLDALPDLLMTPSTAATEALVRWGDGALPKVAPLLRAPRPVTRQRAFLVLQAVAGRDPQVWRDLWRRLGRYDPLDADVARRDAAAAQWDDWVRGGSRRSA